MTPNLTVSFKFSVSLPTLYVFFKTGFEAHLPTLIMMQFSLSSCSTQCVGYKMLPVSAGGVQNSVLLILKQFLFLELDSFDLNQNYCLEIYLNFKHLMFVAKL